MFEKHDARELIPDDVSCCGSPRAIENESNTGQKAIQFSFLNSKLPFKKILMERTRIESEYANFSRNFDLEKLEEEGSKKTVEGTPETNLAFASKTAETSSSIARIAGDTENEELAKNFTEEVAQQIRNWQETGVTSFNFKKRPRELSKDEKVCHFFIFLCLIVHFELIFVHYSFCQRNF